MLRITLPAYYHDGMVMQADHDERLIWGLMNYLLDPVLVTVTSDLEGLAHHKGTGIGKKAGLFAKLQPDRARKKINAT